VAIGQVQEYSAWVFRCRQTVGFSIFYTKQLNVTNTFGLARKVRDTILEVVFFIFNFPYAKVAFLEIKKAKNTHKIL
jgi:hypothetical protein